MKTNSFKILFIIAFFLSLGSSFAQNNLQFYIDAAFQNNPTMKENSNLLRIGELNKSLTESQYSLPQISLTSNYLFAPFFNNNGKIISTNPDSKAIGYDAGITNGGLYSALINIEKNIFNGGLTDALQKQIGIQQEQFKYNFELERRNLKKQVTEQYLNAYKSLLIYHLANDVVKNIEDQLTLTAGLVEKGYSKSQNYLLLKIELQSQQIVSKENFQQYKNDLLQLNSFCGVKDTQTVFIDSARIKMNDAKTKFTFLEKFNLDSLAAVIQQDVFETKYQPQVKLFFNTGLNAVELEGIQRKFGLSAGIDFQMPIYDGGQKGITRQQNEISISTIRNYKQFAATNIENQKQITISNIKLIQDNLKSIDTQLNDYKDLINLSNKQLRTGDVSMIDYLIILRNFIDLQKTKIEKEINMFLEINNYNYWY
ncbi:MAG: TolC family protein [Ignavibacteriales bacterium]|nr:TolC family protein [Ignavibacteriales bacterium]